jgi:hypothetical protein
VKIGSGRQALVVLGAALFVVMSLTLGLALYSQAKRKQHPFQNDVATSSAKTPFADNNGLIPPKSQYDGPMFKLSHNWPATPPDPIKDPPWVQAIGGGPITPENAAAYVAALKAYVAPNARKLVWDYANWDADKSG